MNWFKNYQVKNCKTWIGKLIQMLVFSWIYKIIFLIILVVIGSIGINFDIWAFVYVYYTGLFGLLALALAFIIYAWIINPIKSLIDKKKENK